MNKDEIKKSTNPAIFRRVQKLREEISRLRYLYHVKNDKKITDDVYESLMRELNDLEKKYPKFSDINSSINRVAGEPLDKFKKVKHESQMFSMNDVFTRGELEDWENRISKLINEKHSYFCEIKLDGLSASLIYQDGVFVRGATRGDGFTGEDITENLRMINSIPMNLSFPYPEYIEVRGEVVMPKKVWNKLNKKQEKAGKQLFANTRNAAAGSLRQLDPKIVKERNLDFFAWDLVELRINNEELKVKNHSYKHDILRELGFQLAPYEKKVKKLEEVISFIDEVETIRKDLPYGTDGMVVSIDELDLQERLGVVGKAPRYMVAYKYQAERATTKVLDITVNVGRTGVLTPLAHFEPTLVAGSTVSKATLHNMDQINRLDIRIGDTVVIQKAGDVIPEVVEVLDKLRDGKEKKFKMPNLCPVCKSKVNKKETSKSSVAFYCSNKKCPARDKRGLEHFVNIFEIYEIGPKIISRLKEEGLISDAADFFALEKADLSGLERFGDKSAENIINSINVHKNVPFWRFIYALGIIHVGEQTAQDLANHFNSLSKLRDSSLEEIIEIENIGPIVAKSIYTFFKDKININFINKLFLNGVNILYEKSKSKKLDKKVFVLTGTLSTMSREEAKKKIIENGGRVSGSISLKTDYLLIGENPGSKYIEAEKLGTKIIKESEFLKII